MRILAIGDPHGNIEALKKIDYNDVDLILVPGDLAKADLARKLYFDRVRGEDSDPELRKKAALEIYESTVEVLRFLGEKAPTYFIYGDFDYSEKAVKMKSKELDYEFPSVLSQIKAIKNVKIVSDKLVEFKGVKIGSVERFQDINWVRDFKPKDYDEEMKEANEETNKAREILNDFGNVDILMCHQPPFGILDKVKNPSAPKNWQGLSAGSELILEYIKEKKPKYVVCGHIHEGEGEEKVGGSMVYNLGTCGSKIIEID